VSRRRDGLLTTESKRDFARRRKRLFEQIGPMGMVEQEYADSFVHDRWEIERYREIKAWFVASQSFVRKAVLRGKEVDALASFWGYTLRPLVELLRMRYCPVRWDFGMRYLDRDLPSTVYARLRDLIFVRDLGEIEAKLPEATAWAVALLRELDQPSASVRVVHDVD